MYSIQKCVKCSQIYHFNLSTIKKLLTLLIFVRRTIANGIKTSQDNTYKVNVLKQLLWLFGRVNA